MTFFVPTMRLRLHLGLLQSKFRVQTGEQAASMSVIAAETTQESLHDIEIRDNRNHRTPVTLGCDDPGLLDHRYLLALNL